MARVGNVRGEEVEDAIGQATAIRTDFTLYMKRFFPASSSSSPSSSRPEIDAVGRALYNRTEAHIGITRELLERLEAELEKMNGDAPSAQEEQLREWLEAIDEEDAALDDVAATLEEQLGIGDENDNENDAENDQDETNAAGPMTSLSHSRNPGNNGNSGNDHDHEDDEEDEEDEDDIVSKAATQADAAPLARGGIASVSSRGSEERPRSSHMRGQRQLSGSPLAQHAMSLRNSARQQPPLSPLTEAPSGNTSAGSSPTLRRQRQPSSAAAHSEPAVLDLADEQVAGASGSATAVAALAPGNPPFPVICAEGHEALTDAELTIIAGEQVVFLGGDGGTGWSMVENGRGLQGFVPTDFLDLPVRLNALTAFMKKKFFQEGTNGMPKNVSPLNS